ncbi:MAG TPA: signal peptidase I [Thermoanaerobaculia bacterium]
MEPENRETGSPRSEKPRRPWIAAALTLLVPGLGQLYGGELKRALAVYLGYYCLFIALLVSGLPRTFGGLIVLLLAALLLHVWMIWDAVRIARRNTAYVLKPYNRWYLYLVVMAVAFFLSPRVLALSPVRAFQIPSGNMEPAVRVGDHLYADMRYYRSAGPARGDLAVLASPENSALIIMRVIGLEGERIEIRDKKVYIDSQPLADPWGRYQAPQNNTFAFEIPELQQRDNFGPLKIPMGSVFVMGDNRDNSYDSRFIGPVPISSLRGRLLYVYWSPDRSRIGTYLR